MLQTVSLGDTGVETSPLGLGCADLMSVGPQARRTVLAAALDAGVRHLDVAPMYGLGAVEGEIGRFAAGRRDRLVLATKFGIEPSRVARALAPEPAAAVRPDEQRAVRRQHAPQLRDAGVELVLVHVLEHVLRDDEVERRVLEREGGQGRDLELRLRDPFPRARDRGLGEIGPGEARRRPGLLCVDEEAARSAARVEDPSARRNPAREERVADRADAPVPPVGVLERADALVVVARDARSEQRGHHVEDANASAVGSQSRPRNPVDQPCSSPVQS